MSARCEAPDGAPLPPRAQTLLVDRVVGIARRERLDTVALPALYCPETAAAIANYGLQLKFYDVSLAAGFETQAQATKDEVRIWWHAFGLHRMPPPSLAHPESRLVIDGCHALRSCFLAGCAGPPAEAAIFSPRKELRLSAPGFALTPAAAGSTTFRAEIESRAAGLSQAALTGRNSTQKSKLHLGDRLPSIGRDDVLSVLPLLAEARDEVIGDLREAGATAWRWLEDLPRPEAFHTPCAQWIAARLVLVSVPVEPESVDALLGLLRMRLDGFLPWR